MTNEEIHEYIAIRNGQLGGDELSKIQNTHNSPQIDHIKFSPMDNKFQMWSNDGDYFEFYPIPYEEYIKTKKKEK